MALTKGCFNIKAVKPAPPQPADALANIESNPVFAVVFDGTLKREDKVERLALLFRNAAAPGSRFETCVGDLKTMHRFLLKEHATTAMEVFKLSLNADEAEKARLNTLTDDLNRGVFSAYSIIHAAFNAAGNSGLAATTVAAGITASYEQFNRISGHEPPAAVPQKPAPVVSLENEVTVRRAPLKVRRLG